MKEKLKEAAKTLLWESGYESMSPRRILDTSGAGHGSLYHHYSGKKDLAVDAILQIEQELINNCDAIFDQDKAPLNQIKDYLRADRDGLRGCRLGRLANETDVLSDPDLREPIARYFRHVARRISEALHAGVRDGSVKPELDIEAVATTILAVVQGGFLISRATADPCGINLATRGMVSLLAGCIGLG
jgi:TetR/AcrR family transcriptional regulator, transcriptional repressor for nem operon